MNILYKCTCILKPVKLLRKSLNVKCFQDSGIMANFFFQDESFQSASLLPHSGTVMIFASGIFPTSCLKLLVCKENGAVGTCDLPVETTR